MLPASDRPDIDGQALTERAERLADPVGGRAVARIEESNETNKEQPGTIAL